MRFNCTAKPFDNPKVRQAVLYALNQEDFLKATIGDPKYYKVCKALFVCGTPLASTKGMDGLLESNFAKSQASCSRRRATTARRSCCCIRPTCRC